MKKYLAIGIALGLIGWHGPATAYDHERVVANLAEDFADCATYFNFVAGSAAANHWEQLAKDYVGHRDRATQILIMLMSDQPDGRVLSKLRLHNQSLVALLGEEGVDGVMLRYKDLCKTLLEDPTPRIRYWEGKR